MKKIWTDVAFLISVGLVGLGVILFTLEHLPR